MLYEHPIFGIFHSIASAMFSLTAIFGNVIVIYAFWIASSISRSSRLLLLSLAASDLGVGLLVQPLNAAMMAKMLGLAVSRHGNAVDDQDMTLLYPLVKPSQFFSVLFGGASLLTLGAIAIDRYLALSLHLRCAELVTTARERFAISAHLDNVVSGRSAANVNRFQSNYSGIWCIVRDLNSFVRLFKIFRILSHHQNLICVQVGQRNQICQLTHFGRAKKLAMKTLYIYVILIVCYSPSLFIFPVFMKSKNPSALLTLFYYVGAFLVLFNSCLNPLVYCWKLCEVRETVVDVLRRMF